MATKAEKEDIDFVIGRLKVAQMEIKETLPYIDSIDLRLAGNL